MVILEVHARFIKVKYKSTLLSQASFLYVICGMLSVVLPFIFAYKSGGFWLKRDVFHEQPKINFKGEYLLVANTDNISHSIICSTTSYYRTRLGFLDSCSTIKLREIDNNLDGKNDKLSLSIEINTLDNKITELHLVLPLNYQLTSTCPLKMQSAIIYQHYFPHKRAIDLRIVGNLNIFQSSAIRCDGKGYNFYDHSVIDNEKNEYELEDIIKRYSDRNVSTHLTNVYTNIKTGNGNKFNLKLMIRYPEHKIHYKPGFWQIIKWAWMQYFAVFIIISWLITRVKNYIYKHKLVLFYEESPFKKLN